MKITKFPQSHLVIEKDGKKLIIDPGLLSEKEGFDPILFKDADAYLVTHQHADHLDPDNAKKIIQDAPVYGNADVVTKLTELGVETGIVVEHLEKFDAAGFQIQAVELPHFPLPNGNPVPPNTGFLIDGIFFHSGDGQKLLEEGIHSENAALALGMPMVSPESVENVKAMLTKLQAKVYIPIHYSARPADPHESKPQIEQTGVEVKILGNNESLEL